MADITFLETAPISQLPFAGPLNDTDLVVVVQDGQTRQSTVGAIRTGESGTATKELVIQIGTPPAALTDGRTPDYSFANGTTFTIAALIGMVPTAVRVDNSPYSPIAGQYSFSTTTGTTTFGDVLNDCYIFMKPQVFSGTPPEGEYLVTIDGELITTIDGESIIIL